MTTKTKTTTPAGSPPTLPAWWESARRDFLAGVAHAFLIHGNVWDYVPVGERFLSMESFLISMAGPRIVAVISPERGLVFPIPAQYSRVETAFREEAQRQPLIGALVRAASPTATPSDLGALPVTQRILGAPMLLDALLSDRMRIGTTPVAVLLLNGDLLRIAEHPSLLAQLVAWGRNTAIGASGHLLAMTCEVLAAAPDELRRSSSRWKAVAVPLPDRETRRRFLRYWEQTQGRALPVAAPLTFDGVVQATGGLQLMMLEDVTLPAYGPDAAGDTPITPMAIAAEKARVIASEYADVLRLQDPRWTLDDVGGYAYLVEFFRRTIVAPWQEGRLTVGGVLLSGPPGTGKTFLAEALAGSAGVPLVLFSIARILGHLVGQSETRLERALAAIMALAPCLVFIDEIDQVVARGGRRADGGSQVDNRVFARLLTFLEDPARRAAQALVIAATNRPDLLDPALLSRFDRTAPVLPPTADDRAALLRRLAAQHGVAASDALIQEVVAATDGWSARDLRNLFGVVADLRASMPDGSSERALAEAIEIYAPPLTDAGEMTAAALRMVSDLRLLPPEWRARRARARATPAEEWAPESGPRTAGRRAPGL
jgi:AAA+ superfamily predicted ATPase